MSTLGKKKELKKTHPTLHFKELEKEEKSKPKVSRRKEKQKLEQK